MAIHCLLVMWSQKMKCWGYRFFVSQRVGWCNFPWRVYLHASNSNRFYGRKLTQVALWRFPPSWKAQVCVRDIHIVHTHDVVSPSFLRDLLNILKISVVTLMTARPLCVCVWNWERGEVRTWMCFQSEKSWNSTVYVYKNIYATTDTHTHNLSENT